MDDEDAEDRGEDSGLSLRDGACRKLWSEIEQELLNGQVSGVDVGCNCGCRF